MEKEIKPTNEVLIDLNKIDELIKDMQEGDNFRRKGFLPPVNTVKIETLQLVKSLTKPLTEIKE